MDEDTEERSIEDVVAASAAGAVDDADAVDDPVAVVAAAPTEDRKTALRSLRTHATEHPAAFGSVLPELTAFLADEDRAVRLTTAKLFVAVAEGAPDSVEPVVPALAERLADEEEFYFVRARAAEALGYAALACPDAVANPETLADLTIGLAFDEPEVKTKLAKALEHVALGDPARLAFHADTLAEHLDDDGALVRYHCCSALAAIACERPDAVAPVAGDLVDRVVEEDLDEEGAFVLGRAAEALGILTDSTDADATGQDDESVAEALPALDAVEEPFAADRIDFARSVGGPEPDGDDAAATGPDAAGDTAPIGTVAGIQRTTDDAVEAMTAPADACPSCGIARPEQGPPICPGCGAPF